MVTVFGLGLLIAGQAPAFAAGRRAAMVIDANSGAVLVQRSADEPRYPASLTKMMTLYVVFDLIEQGRLTYQTRIKVSENAAGAQPTKLGLEAGRDIALIDVIKSLVTKSANDMAIAVAEHIAGSEDKFAALMTQKARAIGMPASTFKNASGLPDSDQVTTARDMLTLAMRLQDDFPKHYPLFALRTFTYNGETMRNHNTMLSNVDGVDGIKTGYTRAAGFNLVTSVRRGQKHLVGAVFGGVSAGSRNSEMRTMLTLAMVKAATVKTRKAAPELVADAGTRPGEAKPVRDSKWRTALRAIEATPKSALVQAPTPVERPTRLAVATPAIAAEQPSPVRTVALSDPPAVDSALKPGPIEVARVRPVLVAPRPPRQAPVVAAALPEAPLPPASDPPAVVAPTSPPAPRFAQASLAPATTAGPQRGAAPSTLQQQADALNRSDAAAVPSPQRIASATGTPPAAFRLKGPDAVGATGGIQIQIGAFASEAEALRQLDLTRAKSGGLLDAYRPMTQPVQANGRQMYRARYAGFDTANAASVCTELRRRQIDCLVARE